MGSLNFPDDEELPQLNDPVYLGNVERSDASYVIRIDSVIGRCLEDCFRVRDVTGRGWLIRRFPVRDLGHQRAWIALGEVPDDD